MAIVPSYFLNVTKLAQLRSAGFQARSQRKYPPIAGLEARAPTSGRRKSVQLIVSLSLNGGFASANRAQNPVTLLSPCHPLKKGANPLWQGVLTP